jgi:hypothetical protein
MALIAVTTLRVRGSAAARDVQAAAG